MKRSGFNDGRYVLNVFREPVPCADLLEWAGWLEKANRIVSREMVGNVKVSTVFLGLDHNFSGVRRPVLFETMIFGGEHDSYQDRCCTWNEAELMHQRAIERVRGSTSELDYQRPHSVQDTLCYNRP